jgi:hypothetical protein
VPVQDLKEAERILSQVPEYAWLITSQKPWWTVAEVSEQLGIGESVVRSWCDRGLIPGAVLHSRQTGWRMPRSGLIQYLAEAYHRD